MTSCEAPAGTMVAKSKMPALCSPADLKAGDCQYVCGRGPILKEGRERKKPFGCYENMDTEYKNPLFENRSRFESFNWFQDPGRKLLTNEEAKKKEKEDLAKALARDEIPIPPILPERYPYRFTSSRPSVAARSKLEWQVRKAYLRLHPITSKQATKRFDPRDIAQIKGYETSTMTASLQPFHGKKKHDMVFKSGGTSTSINEPLYIPWKANSEFDQYVIDYLHPNWRDDPLYRRRIVFHFRKEG